MAIRINDGIIDVMAYAHKIGEVRQAVDGRFYAIIFLDGGEQLVQSPEGRYWSDPVAARSAVRTVWNARESMRRTLEDLHGLGC